MSLAMIVSLVIYLEFRVHLRMISSLFMSLSLIVSLVIYLVRHHHDSNVAISSLRVMRHHDDFTQAAQWSLMLCLIQDC